MSNQSNAAVVEEPVQPTKTIHQEVAEGIVRLIRHVSQEARPGGWPVNELYAVAIGKPEVSSLAKTYVFEFVKDGGYNMTKDHVADILKGKYSLLWKTVNKYLKHFGHQPVEPVPLTP